MRGTEKTGEEIKGSGGHTLLLSSRCYLSLELPVGALPGVSSSGAGPGSCSCCYFRSTPSRSLSKREVFSKSTAAGGRIPAPLRVLILSAMEPVAGKAEGKEDGTVCLLSTRQGTRGWGTSFRARGQNCVEYSSVQGTTVQPAARRPGCRPAWRLL